MLPAAPGSSAFVVLASSSGTLTPAGELYYCITGAQPPTRQFDPNQTPVNRGGSTFITGRDGRPLKLRFMGADGQLQLTAAGREYYKDARDEFVVTVPVVVRGKRKNGTLYERDDVLPVDQAGINQVR